MSPQTLDFSLPLQNANGCKVRILAQDLEGTHPHVLAISLEDDQEQAVQVNALGEILNCSDDRITNVPFTEEVALEIVRQHLGRISYSVSFAPFGRTLAKSSMFAGSDSCVMWAYGTPEALIGANPLPALVLRLNGIKVHEVKECTAYYDEEGGKYVYGMSDDVPYLTFRFDNQPASLVNALIYLINN